MDAHIHAAVVPLVRRLKSCDKIVQFLRTDKALYHDDKQQYFVSERRHCRQAAAWRSLQRRLLLVFPEKLHHGHAFGRARQLHGAGPTAIGIG